MVRIKLFFFLNFLASPKLEYRKRGWILNSPFRQWDEVMCWWKIAEGNKIEGAFYQLWTTLRWTLFASDSNALLSCLSPMILYLRSLVKPHLKLSCSELCCEMLCPCGRLGDGFVGGWDLYPGTCVRSVNPVVSFQKYFGVVSCSSWVCCLLANWTGYFWCLQQG